MSTVDDGTHECPAPGCEVRVVFDRFACPAHWYSLPEELRQRLWRAWHSSNLSEHAAARDACVAYLEQKAAA